MSLIKIAFCMYTIIKQFFAFRRNSKYVWELSKFWHMGSLTIDSYSFLSAERSTEILRRSTLTHVGTIIKKLQHRVEESIIFSLTYSAYDSLANVWRVWGCAVYPSPYGGGPCAREPCNPRPSHGKETGPLAIPNQTSRLSPAHWTSGSSKK